MHPTRGRKRPSGAGGCHGQKRLAGPAFRELGAWLHRGIDLKSVYLYWYGNEFGSRFPEGSRCCPLLFPLEPSSTTPVGIAMASNIKGEDDVTVAYIGDGGTSTGDFSEALNFAGVFNAPVVFIVQNNQYCHIRGQGQADQGGDHGPKGGCRGDPRHFGGRAMISSPCTRRRKRQWREARSSGGPTLIEATPIA